MFRSIFFFATLILLFLMGNLNAATYYVDNGEGNDGNSGKSTSLPWKTLNKVQSSAFNSGDIISLKCGNRYILTADFNVPANNITFNSYGTGTRPTIDGNLLYKCVKLGYPISPKSYVTFNGIRFVRGGDINVELIECDHITFESCNIDSGKEGGIYSGLGSYLTVRNSTSSYHSTTAYYAGHHGIYLDGTDNVLMEYDTMNYNAHSGFRCAYGYDNGSTDNMTLRYCVARFNGDYAHENDGVTNSNIYYNLFESGLTTGGGTMYLWNPTGGTPPSNCNYYNNTFITHSSFAIQIGDNDGGIYTSITGMVFKNNIFYNDANTYGIYFFGSTTPSNWTFNNNLYYGLSSMWHLNSDRTFLGWKTLGYDANGLNTNPLFTLSSDFSLQSGSLARGAGTNVSLTQDILGNSVSSSPDIGAYQYNTSSATIYYVANNGNDANLGTSTSSPWKTISKVNSKTFNPGDNILFRRGDTWSEILTPHGSGNATNPITYDAYGTGNLPIIDGGTTRNNCISLIGLNYITIRNFRVQYAAVNTTGDIHAQNTDHLRIENCDCYITSHGGVFVESSTNPYVGNCTMSSPVSNNDNQADGIYSQRNSDCIYENNSIVISDNGAGHNDGIQSYLDADMTIRNNYIYQNNSLTQAQGIDMTDGAGTFYIYNNVVKCPNSNGNIIGFNNDVSGTGVLRCYQNTVLGNVNCLRILKCADVIVKNNIFYTNSATSIIDIGTTLNSGSSIDYNLYNRSGSGSIVWYEPQGYKTYAQWQAMGYETHGLNANPIVNDTLCPSINSPVVNVGTDLGGIFSFDKEGTPRPINGVDLGAYELKSAPTPVELTAFSGVFINNSVRLTWSTATEINNQGFEIERNTNSSWVKIGFMEGKGNSITKNDYSFEDKTPVGSKIQYRLKQIDNNGNFKYYDVISVTAIPQDFSIGNYPNPFNPSTKIRYSLHSESMINLVIYNLIGERIDELKNELQQPGTYEINWNGSGHPSGIYLLSMIESPINGSAKNSKTIKMNLIK